MPQTQIVDRAARDDAAYAIRRLINGRVTNDEFETLRPETQDGAVAALWQMMWLFYSDMKEHRLSGPNRLSPADRREIVRWILFLDSDLPYVWPTISFPGLDPARRAGPFALLRQLSGRHALSNKDADRFLAAGDYAAWPFASRSDFKQALRRPRRLSGCGRRPSMMAGA